MPDAIPTRPTNVDHYAGIAWIAIASALPVTEFWGTMSTIAAVILTGVWGYRLTCAMAGGVFEWHWSWLVWPALLTLALILHLIVGFEHFFLL